MIYVHCGIFGKYKNTQKGRVHSLIISFWHALSLYFTLHLSLIFPISFKWASSPCPLNHESTTFCHYQYLHFHPSLDFKCAALWQPHSVVWSHFLWDPPSSCLQCYQDLQSTHWPCLPSFQCQHCPSLPLSLFFCVSSLNSLSCTNTQYPCLQKLNSRIQTLVDPIHLFTPCLS